MSRKEYIRQWRKDNPKKVQAYNEAYYMRKKEGLIVGKPQRGDRTCPKCGTDFNGMRLSGKFVILYHTKAKGRKEVLCAYTLSFNKEEILGDGNAKGKS